MLYSADVLIYLYRNVLQQYLTLIRPHGWRMLASNVRNSAKLDSVTKHEQLELHKNASVISKANTTPQKENSCATHALKSWKKASFDQIAIMFRTCHALVLNDRPLSDFNWMRELDEVKGLPLGKAYRGNNNNDAANSFTHAVASDVFRFLSQFVNDRKFLCIVGDGSTDNSVVKQEMWFARTCKDTQFFSV